MKDIEELNPHKQLMQIREAKEFINSSVARRFIRLAENDQVPEWAIALLEKDLTRIRLAAI